MSCDVGEVTESLENEFCSFSNISVTLPTAQLIFQPFRCFTYVTGQSPIQPFFRFSYVTDSLLMSHGEPPMLISLNQI